MKAFGRSAAEEKRTYYINGRFLAQPLSGVQRYAREIVAALDRAIVAKPDPDERWAVITTLGAEMPDYKAIGQVVTSGRLKGHAWEQWTLARATRDGFLINLANTASLRRGAQLSVIHDMSVYRNPDYFSRSYGAWHRFLGRMIVRRAELATVSDFSRREMAEIFSLDASTIAVLRNGCDHMLGQEETLATYGALKLETRPYFVVLGNQNRNKNLAAAFAAIAQVPDVDLVVIGSRLDGVFGEQGGGSIVSDRVHFVGRLDDAEVAGLLRHAAALIFPSFYEGFGIPPLEALAKGCAALCSDIPPVRENCGAAASYFDPHVPEQLVALMRAVLAERPEEAALRRARGEERLRQLTWDIPARRLLAICREWPGRVAL